MVTVSGNVINLTHTNDLHYQQVAVLIAVNHSVVLIAIENAVGVVARLITLI